MSLKKIYRKATALFLPTFLIMVLLFGGASHEGQASHLWIQMAAAALLFAFARQAIETKWPPALLGFLAIVTILVVWTLLQLVPLPEAIWSKIGDRSVIQTGYALLGFSVAPNLPISLAPENSLTSLLGFLPPLAAIVLATTVGRRTGWSTLCWIIPAIGAFSAVLGLIQVFLGPDSSVYFYAISNRRFPVGIFSNANHQATLMLMCLPFVAALAGNLRSRWQSLNDDMGQAVAICALFMLNLVGLLAAGSVAGYALLIPVLLFCLLIVGRKKGKPTNRMLSGGLLLLSTLLCAILVAFSPNLDGLGATSFEDHETSRIGIWKTTQTIGVDNGLLGAGLGAYEEVYHLYEDPETVTSRYVNHAHNDYLEIWIDWGLPGVVLIAAALLLWCIVFIRIWFNPNDKASRISRAASIAVLVIIAHSFVDYPLRTPAIATLGALCLAITLADRNTSTAKRN